MPTYLQFAPRALYKKRKQKKRGKWEAQKRKRQKNWQPKKKTEARQAMRKTKGSLRCLWRRAHKQALYTHLQRVTSSFINSFFFLIIQQVKLVDISSFPGSCVQTLQAAREIVKDNRQFERMLPPSSEHGRKRKREKQSESALNGSDFTKVVCTGS